MSTAYLAGLDKEVVQFLKDNQKVPRFRWAKNFLWFAFYTGVLGLFGWQFVAVTEFPPWVINLSTAVLVFGCLTDFVGIGLITLVILIRFIQLMAIDEGDGKDQSLIKLAYPMLSKSWFTSPSRWVIAILYLTILSLAFTTGYPWLACVLFLLRFSLIMLLEISKLVVRWILSSATIEGLRMGKVGGANA